MFKYRIIFVVFTLLSVFPIASETIPSDSSVIVITRTDSSYDRNQVMYIFINSVRKGSLADGESLTFTVNNGSHTIMARIGSVNSNHIRFTANSRTFPFTANVRTTGLLIKKTEIELTLDRN